ncbi:OLC1v1017542C3 [Oldenlandia corymbosa var. corymbosa]|uniref:Laccase n=1 Tax=Oldenlandia corymbosa var. corymbosa TaxID=529605 RepID=A0AAV1E9N4_OLDCO|nr:OLC1v1017542C3 [Oldenlandia corymbosa var. corymbosa]
MGLKMMKGFMFQLFLLLLSLASFQHSEAMMHKYTFVIKEVPYTRLCGTKNILTVNGQFPGPTLHLRRGDTTIIRVFNKGNENITIHWHGVKQPRYPWSDGPAYITQCPIMPGKSFTQQIKLSDEIGTMWWHAHSDWSRATVHGAIIVYPRMEDVYPFPKPNAEVPLVLGEWWKSDIQAVVNEFRRTGGDPNISDAFLINGQPGDLYPCSKQDTFKLAVEYGKTYLLRMVNAAMNNILFFGIANHNLTVVGSDGSYLRPYTTDYIAISPGETFDVFLEANQKPDHYYMAAKAYQSVVPPQIDNTTTTGIIEYVGNYTPSSPPIFPNLPRVNDINASHSFFASLRSLGKQVDVPIDIDTKLFFTLSVNLLPCEANNTCAGPGGRRFAASVSNISFVDPKIDLLQAYYGRVRGIYRDQFPSFPPLRFNFTGTNLSASLQLPTRATKLRVLKYNDNVEIVYQNTNLLNGIDHPMHLHGHSFYVVGSGFGNFDPINDPLTYNLVDPPHINTIAVPRNGWTTIRFKANNPGRVLKFANES